ncbi:Peptidase S54, rhomboid domain [Cinara cedri]|uniref:Derlin n=1 Tax=Cinara cedri TaxID=506608 RepID=A0A5E4NEL7_9HEMI|nr:Peptidase S54, rhomboid domain [Cinara cedri]
MADFTDWFKNIPYFTKRWLSLTVMFTLAARFGILNPIKFVLIYEPFVKKFEIWRAVTGLFMYPLSPGNGLHFLINCYFLYSYSLRLETDLYSGRPADYFFLLLFNWICCVVIALLADIMILMDPMVLSILYVWCQLNKDAIVSFWFGTRFKAMYLPWVLFGFNLIISGGGLQELVGIIVGHTYFFLMYKYPQEMGGPQLIQTPQIFYKFFPNERTVHGFGQAPTRATPAAAAAPNQPQGGNEGINYRRHNWGRGYVLGQQQ